MMGLLLGALTCRPLHRIPKDGLKDLASFVPWPQYQVPSTTSERRVKDRTNPPPRKWGLSTRPDSGPSQVALPRPNLYPQ